MSSSTLHPGQNVLVLNHVGEALSFTSWLRAVGLVHCGRAMALEASDRVIRCQEGTWEIQVPLVVMLSGGKYVRPHHHVRLTRRNLFARDGFQCLYCGFNGETALLTMDHVVPRALGGQTKWENLATACRSCNQKKGSRTLKQAGMQLRAKPATPKHMLQLHKRAATPLNDTAYDIWERYLPAPRRWH